MTESESHETPRHQPDPGDNQGQPPEFKAITSETELAAWKKQTRQNMLDEIRAQLADERKADEEKAAKKREQAEAEARGEFEKVRTDLENERDKLTSSLKDANDRLKAYDEAIGPIVEERRKALEGVKDGEAIKDFDVKASALDQLHWLNDRTDFLARMGVISLTKAEETREAKEQKAIVPETPQNGDPSAKPTDEAARASWSRIYQSG